MSWLTKVISGTIGKKFLMAFTGLFLIIFLVVHLVGNLQLFKDDGGYAFNTYSLFMTTNPLIKTVSYILYISILAHAFVSLLLYFKNRRARPVQYKSNRPEANTSWESRNMGILGTIIFVFLVIHMKTFWYSYKFGEPPYAKYEIAETGSIEKTAIPYEDVTEALKHEEGVYKDLYAIVVEAFSQWWYVAFYVVALIALAYHLFHGFQSSFQTAGLKNKGYSEIIKKTGIAFSIIICTLFALMPLYFFFIYK